jgi:pSer/pThr/pTyr-binding forkhead associated (FHA) protein
MAAFQAAEDHVWETHSGKRLCRRIAEMARLLLKFKGTILREIPVTTSPLLIGREPDNDIVIEDRAVSRRHAKIFYENNCYVIEDLKSGNGLCVNDNRITKTTLTHQDNILVGKHVLVFVHEETPPSQEDTPASLSPAAETVILNPKTQQTLLALHAGKIPVVAEKRAEPAGGIAMKRAELTGSIAISSGGVYRDRMVLTKQTTTGGKSSTADIKLRGVFVGHIAFIISKRPEGFFITHSGGKRMTRVNGVVVAGRRELKDKDIITIGATKMQFYSSAPASFPL